MTYTINNTMLDETISLSATGTAGQVYTTNNTSNGLYWGLNGTSATNSSWATISADPNLQGQTLKVMGNAEISGELTVQGVKLSDRLDKIEERLGILRPNEELEEKWEKLRALRNAYKELEAEIIEKEEIWKILKK
jgi:hypothetical protein